jgi:hypothetical protein
MMGLLAILLVKIVMSVEFVKGAIGGIDAFDAQL